MFGIQVGSLAKLKTDTTNTYRVDRFKDSRQTVAYVSVQFKGTTDWLHCGWVRVSNMVPVQES